MEQLYQRMDRMMDKKLEKVYSELKAISKTVDPDYYSEEEEEVYDYESEEYTEDEDEPINASMARLQSEKFWIEGRCERMRDGMFSGPENMPAMMLGMLHAFKIAVPFQNWLRKGMEEERQRALADPSCTAMERQARLHPPPGSVFEMLQNTFKTAKALQGKPLEITKGQKEHAAMFFALGDIYMTDE